MQPTTEKMFQVACATLDIDLITIDATGSKFPIKHGYVKQALDRGISFEIVYGQSILNPSIRSKAIMAGNSICRVTRGKNVIFTSAADSDWILRSPADAINLAGVFGVPAHFKKAALVEHPRLLMEHAAAQKLTFRSAVISVPEALISGSQKYTSDMQEDFIRF